ncbi:MAG: hypothetical protein JRI68_02845, partial [Deltaproteobacteria bacterium]|nr:hypothetical protein [Deltaproteobacteria bacterium]
DRLERLNAIHTALTAGPRSQPQSYWQATLRIDDDYGYDDTTKPLLQSLGAVLTRAWLAPDEPAVDGGSQP